MKNSVPKFDAQTKKTLMSVFLILFLDLMSFSIIFPLFPEMLKYYSSVEGQSGLFGWMLKSLEHLEVWVLGSSDLSQNVPIVLFGGILGSLFAILQFIFAPILGGLSDRFGRKPILLASMIGLAVSNLGWIFAQSFWLLVLTRVISGIMSGNISTATAVVSDSTDQKNRSAGMAVIGIAIGTGFIFGPAIGGLLALIDLSEPLRHVSGINPFSLPAAGAFIFSIFNVVYVSLFFKESLSVERRGKLSATRRFNPLAVLETRPYPGVLKTILSYFFFLILFAGMEFSLTFFAVDRFGFEAYQNGLMFVYIGVLLALVQGGYVRRRAHLVGEKKMALHGMVLIAPGLILIGLSQQLWLFFIGLAFLAIGAALVIPCLTTLVSFYAPIDHQGRYIGIFRSMGSLARAIGPFLACMLYYRLGPGTAYMIAGGLMVIPLGIGWRLPKVKDLNSAAPNDQEVGKAASKA